MDIKLHLIYNKKGNSRILTDTDIEPFEKLYNGNSLFRKMLYEYKYNNEYHVYELLLQNKAHSNIVNIYKLGHNYVDIELLDIEYKLTYKIINIMKGVKKYLHSIGVIYLDWREDNFGLSIDGNIKIFDFNSAGILDNNGNWIKKPPLHYHYSRTLDIGITDPYKIDDYIFWKNIVNSNYIIEDIN